MLEVDEHEHHTYCAGEEIKRMADIAQSFGVPVTFVRYNPDVFMTLTRDTLDKRNVHKNNKERDVGTSNPRKTLLEMVGVAKAQPGELFTETFVQVVYLFYSGDHPHHH